MDHFAPGTFAFVSYAGIGLWHERLVLAWISEGEYIILTPDGDIYIEQLDLSSQDLDGHRVCASGRECPMA